jgi:hypothetical protein
MLLTSRMRLRTVAAALGALGLRRNNLSALFACDPSAHDTLPKYCDTTYPTADRISDLISRLTLEEKVRSRILVSFFALWWDV